MTDAIDSKTSASDVTDSDRTAQARLILNLRSEGVTDPNVLRVMEKIPRRLFTSESHPGNDHYFNPLPIECGQTVSAPNIVAKMTAELELDKDCKVFEVGTGSGYQTAMLASLSGHVFTTERFKTLINLAKKRLNSLGLTNVTIFHSDGMQGLSEHAPYDRIILTAANPEIPQQLIEQLSPNGIMILPVGDPGAVQKLVKLVRDGESYEEIFLCYVRFVPIRDGIAKKM